VLTALRRQVPAGTPFQEVTWKDRSYFLGATYQAMQRALIDHARRRNAQRKVRLVQVEDLRLHDLAATAQEHPEWIEALALALERLRARHPELAELVEHRYFAGYTIDQTARVMGKGERTVRRWWDQARALLHDEVLRILNEVDIGGTA
jgi:DNA-directed RNA polymerase specialized sigma24 family protein